MKESNHLYTNTDLCKLLVPIIVEQLLSCLMGTVDTMMVSNVGSAAISAVSLVDSINVLVIQALSALAAGGAILCSHYLGNQNEKHATHAARQVLLVMTVLSTALTLLCLFSRASLLRLIFGKVEADVMTNSQVYFLFTLLSFPFIGLYDAGASVMRAQNDSRHPMIISVISNFLNIGGNAILIFVLHMGVAGAAISTLVSRIFCAVVVIWELRNEKNPISIRNYLAIRPDFSSIKKILCIGIPSGIENSMFQFGKLAIQSTVSTLGTIAIAAQAMTNILENLNGVAAIGIGIGLMTVVGQCLGAGRKDEAIYYIKAIPACGSSHYRKLSARPGTYQTDHHTWRHGSRKCQTLFPDDGLYHHRKAGFLGSFLYPRLWHESGRRCEILHDYLLLHHVALPCGLMRLLMPYLGFWTNRRVDRHVRRLES